MIQNGKGRMMDQKRPKGRQRGDHDGHDYHGGRDLRQFTNDLGMNIDELTGSA
jgi:hypothetical protein